MDAKELGKRYVHPMSAEDDRDACGGSYGDTGITLRQHFAGLAMQGSIAAMSDDKARTLVIENADESGRTAKEQIAFAAVEYADALLAELSKEPTT